MANIDIKQFMQDAIDEHGERHSASPVDANDGFTAEAINEALRSLPPKAQEEIRAQAQPWGYGANAANAFLGGLPATMSPHLESLRAPWAAEHPMGDLATNVAGSLPLALGAGVLGQEYIAGPAAARAASMAPRLLEQFPKASRVLSEAFSGAMQGATGNAATAMVPGNDQSLGETVLSGAKFGGVMNPALRGMGRLAGLGTNIAPETAEAAASALRAGLSPRPGQMPGANWGQRLAEWLGGGESGERQLYSKLSGMLGSPTGAIDQKWLNATRQAHGQTMEQITTSNPFKVDSQAIAELKHIRDSAPSMMSKDNAEHVRGLVETIAKDIQNNGGLNGINSSIYHDWIKKGGVLENALGHENSSISNSAQGIKSAIEDAWGRGLPPDVADQWHHARQAYKFTSALDEQLATGKPLDPAALTRAVESRTGGDYTKAKWNGPNGPVDLGELAHGASVMMKPGEGISLHPSREQRTGMGALAGLALPALGGAGLGAAALSYEPTREVIRQWAHDPVGMTAPVAASGLAGYLGMRGLGARVNTPAAMERIIEALREAGRSGASPAVRHMGGINPLIPAMQPVAPEWTR